MKNKAVFYTLLALAPALLAGVSMSASAAECANEWDHYVIETIRADTWCSAEPPSDLTSQKCIEHADKSDQAWSSYANCMLLDSLPKP